MDGIRLIPRTRYLDRIAPFAGTRLIKVITGLRRVGKSCVLRMLADRAAQTAPDVPVIFIDKERSRWEGVTDGASLEAEARTRAGTGSASVFIDEAQEIDGFATALRSMAAEGRYDIYVTGSNARLLSGEIATLFAGRTVGIRVHPLSYDEFLTFHGREDSDESLAWYLRFGGLPFLHLLPPDGHATMEYLGGVYDSVILKDVVTRYGIRNPATLARVVEYMADSVGSPSSARNIANFLKSKGVEVSPQAILDYLSHLEDCFALSRVKTLGLSGKPILEGPGKWYFGDLGLWTRIRGFDMTDIGKIVENAVFLRLETDGWTVKTGRVGDREVDFAAERDGRRLYVQASYLLADARTREREFGALLAMNDAWPKLVVSMDPIREDYRGIRHLSLREFLLGNYDRLA